MAGAMAAIMDGTHHHELTVLTGLLGVPGYIISTFLPSIQQLAAKQPRMVKAMLVLVALTTFGFSMIEKIKRTLMSFLISYFMFSTTIDSNDPLYTYVVRWLQSHRKILPEQELQARSKEDIDRNSAQWIPPHTSQSPDDPNAKQDIVYDFNGLQIFWHKWKPYFVSPFPNNRVGPPSFLTVRCFGFSSQPLREIIDEAWKIHRKKDSDNLTAVYRPVPRSGGWRCVARRNRRSMATVVLDPDAKRELLEDVTFYLGGEAKNWYAARGIPYRRGYLFHGRPGTGKTSLSMAIAGQFGLDVYIISLLDPHINDTFLHTFFTNLPKNSCILLEDIDSAGLARETFDKSIASYRTRGSRYRPPRTTVTTRVTLSGLLNAIDGADSPEGHLLIMTTNVPEALDDALVRPGRIDYKIGFKAISPLQARAMFLRMYTGDVGEKIDLENLADSFSKRIPDDVFTPAELQGHLLRFKRKPQEALDYLDSWQLGLLNERKQLEEERRKEEDRRKRREEKRKAKRRALKSSGDNTGSNSDSSSDSGTAYDDAVPVVVNDGYESSYYSELNGDATHADRNHNGITYVDEFRDRYPPGYSPQRVVVSRSRHRHANLSDMREKEKTCNVM